MDGKSPAPRVTKSRPFAVTLSSQAAYLVTKKYTRTRREPPSPAANPGRRMERKKPLPCVSRFSTVAVTSAKQAAYTGTKKYTHTRPAPPPPEPNPPDLLNL